jgi:hypothetical protein
MNALLMKMSGCSEKIDVSSFDQLADLTLPNTKVVPLNDGIHLLVHSGATEGSPEEINDIATILCVNGCNTPELVFGDCVLMDVVNFYDLK